MSIQFVDNRARSGKNDFSTFSTPIFYLLSTSHNCHYVNQILKSLIYYYVKKRDQDLEFSLIIPHLDLFLPQFVWIFKLLEIY